MNIKTNRIYYRLLRLLGLSRISWNLQFKNGLRYKQVTSPDLISLVERLSKGSILEFGCGEGHLPAALQPQYFHRYVGLDISDIAIAKARERTARIGLLNCRFEQADMSKWQGASEPASLIVLEECLYYLSAVQAEIFLKRCFDCLTPDGSILVVIHDNRKHSKTIEVCKEVCKVTEEKLNGSRLYLVCKKK
ncbi:MAG: class I SAM-dependent methyltransferase [Nitrospiraceae bacterium]|nr:class I SAM-dependent methyltransferase [Nitrospiraceae bacterium]